MMKFKTFMNEMKRFEYQITLSYLFIGLLWIFLSDAFFGYFVSDKKILTEYSMIKGFLYILVTALLLFFFVKQQMLKLNKAKEKAEESDRLKSAFLANMSHEIRTPMNGILGFAELLNEPNISAEEQQEYLQIIQKSGKRMLSIINDIIDISKIESGLMKINAKMIDVNEMNETVYRFFKPEVERKGLQFIYKKMLPDNHTLLNTDSEKLQSILTNLLKNSIKFTNQGFIEFGCEKNGELVEFFVKDTGIGIAKERQSAIFERFIQADIEDKMARQGTGLGLAISKAYVEMLQGKIWLQSEVGIGSTFYFTIPYQTLTSSIKSDSEVICNDIEEDLVNSLKILIADDDEVSLKLIEKGVGPFCKEILKATNGLDAVDISRSNPDLDLIFMDIQMPVMNGLEAIKRIREFNSNVIIIAQTAYALSGDKDEAIHAGSNNYITKPIIKENLLQIIRQYFTL